MSSDRQQRANQRNAQLSTGPRSTEGKKRSAINAVRHGLFSKTLTLTPDETPEFHRLVESYLEHFRPRDPIEADLVEELAIAKMRQKRAWRLEADLLRIELGRQRKSHEQDFPQEGPDGRLALAVEWMADEGRTLEYLRRIEAQLRRAWERCLQRLEARRPPEEKIQNEPNPTAGHPAPILVKPQQLGANDGKEKENGAERTLWDEGFSSGLVDPSVNPEVIGSRDRNPGGSLG